MLFGIAFATAKTKGLLFTLNGEFLIPFIIEE